MKVSDVILQLATKIPTVSTRFTDDITLVGLGQVAGVATASTLLPHRLLVGTVLNISAVNTPIVLSSLTRIGVVGTLISSSDHDFTENIPEYLSVILSGSIESEFNGTFSVLNVPNRRTITFTMVNSGALIATGNPQLDNGLAPTAGYNGYKQVTGVPTETTFEFPVVNTIGSPAILTGSSIQTAPRVSGGISLERIIESYTKQPPTKVWLFVVLGDSVASKDRNTLSDATSNSQRSSYIRQQIIESVNIYLIIPTVNEIAGRQARDTAEEVFSEVCKSVLFKQFSTGLYEDKAGPLNFLNHGFVFYNTAFYVHGYSFEQVINLNFEDSVGHGEDVAFRDIDVSLLLSHGTQEDPIALAIDLDDVPL